MITVVIIADGEKEHLKHTTESLSISDIDGGNMEIIDCQREFLWQSIWHSVEKAETPYITFLRAGEYYPQKRFADCIHQIQGYENSPEIFLPQQSLGKKIDPGSVSLFIQPLSDIKEILCSPACLSGAIFRTEMIRCGYQELKSQRTGMGLLLPEILGMLVLAKTQKIGCLNGAEFHSCSPLTDQGGFFPEYQDPDWYLTSLRDGYLPVLERYEEKNDEIPLIVQAQVLYLLRIQLRENMNAADKRALDSNLFCQYYSLCCDCVKRINPELIMRSSQILSVHSERQLSSYLKTALAAMWYEGRKSELGEEIWKLYDQMALPVILQLVEYENNSLRLDFTIDAYLVDQGELSVVMNGERMTAGTSPRYAAVRFFGVPFQRKAYYLEIPVEKLGRKNRIGFNLIMRNGAKKKERSLPVITFGYQSRISHMVRDSYWCFDRYMLTMTGQGLEKDGLLIRRAGRAARMLQEIQVLAKMPFGENRSRRMCVQRLQYWMAWPSWHKKNIWLTFDKLYKGGDCGEYFYKYLIKRNDPEIEPVYVIQKKAADRKRLEQEGYHPLIYGSKEQKLAFLYADMIFATHSSVHGFNGFNAWEIHFLQDRLKAVNTCIQHGLSVQDLTFDSNRIINNNKRYYCASPSEVENLSKSVYDYKKDVLRLTGIPRYDGLVDQARKQILITPTWRSYIAMPSVLGSARPYNPEFKNTEYYRIFESLLSDERLIRTAKEYGYELIYLLHPVISAQKKDFTEHEGICLMNATESSYEDLLTQSCLMVTDYSGVQFDFAYMRKPVVYYHPPTLPPHFKDGGFDYESQGFGEICLQQEELVSVLCDYMSTQCRLRPEYRIRQDAFFAWDDHNSCERIYEDARAYQKEIRKKQRV